MPPRPRRPTTRYRVPSRVPGSNRPWTEEEEGGGEGGRVPDAATVAPSAFGGAGGLGAGEPGASGAPHSGQKRPAMTISRLQDGQTGAFTARTRRESG